MQGEKGEPIELAGVPNEIIYAQPLSSSRPPTIHHELQ